MPRILKNALKLLATGTVSLLIAACYGVPMVFKRITALSSGGTGIRGLQVSFLDGTETAATESTDADGIALCSVPGFSVIDKAVITDVDGTANGGEYADAVVSIGDADSYAVTMRLK